MTRPGRSGGAAAGAATRARHDALGELASLPASAPAGAGWPHPQNCRRLVAGGLDWHFQHFACTARRTATGSAAPLALLLHGTGAASHSWRHLAPLMAAGFEVLAPDLPGHGHTRGPANVDLSLPGMAGAIAQWLQVLGVRPQLLVGHSAGAAIAARWWLDHVPDAGTLPLVALNAALRPLGGIGRMFSPVARLLAFNPLVPAVFSWHAAQPMVLRRLLAGTGSVIDAEGERLYAALVADSRHTAGALRMMASWELEPLQPLLPRLGAQLHLIAGGADRTLPASESESVHRQVRGSSLTVLPGLGHLAHEEDAAAVWAAMRAALGADLGAVQGSVQSV